LLPEHLPSGLRDLIEACLHWKGIDFSNYQVADKNREPADLYTDAQVVSSELNAQYGLDNNDHIVALDLDCPAWLVPSSTAGHSHLYIGTPMTWPDYEKLLNVLAEVGLIEKGYRDASVKRKATFLRLPWVRKGMETLPSITAIEEFLNEPAQPDRRDEPCR
jgi:hypothetical protein